MKKFILSLVAVLSLGIAASAANYTVDESSIDALIENAVEVAPASMEAVVGDIYDVSLKFSSAPQPVVAFILATIPFTNWLALHRMYLGTSPLAVALHIVTLEGCGIVGFLDWVSLLLGTLNDDVSAYVNNGRWWMWANII